MSTSSPLGLPSASTTLNVLSEVRPDRAADQAPILFRQRVADELLGGGEEPSVGGCVPAVLAAHQRPAERRCLGLRKRVVGGDLGRVAVVLERGQAERLGIEVRRVDDVVGRDDRRVREVDDVTARVRLGVDR